MTAVRRDGARDRLPIHRRPRDRLHRPRRHEVRFLRKRQQEYIEEMVTAGMIVIESLGGLQIETAGSFWSLALNRAPQSTHSWLRPGLV